MAQLRRLLLLLPLTGCSLLGWDDLTEGAGGAASSSVADAAASTSAGATPCVSDDAASAFTLTLDDGAHCYRRVHAGLPWPLAELDCEQSYGGHLLTIDSSAEFTLHDELYPADCTEWTSACSDDPMAPSLPRCDSRAWIGARFEDGEPTWTNGVAWTWPETVFAAGEPNQSIDAIALRTEQLLDERPGNCPHPYICEIDP
jgi:hypothetical protein